MTNNDDRAEGTTFAFYSHSDGKCECVIDGKVYPCSSFNEAVDILYSICKKKGELK